MTITKTTRLLSAHETRIRIKLDDPESLTWGMSTLTLAEGHEKAVIDWGDGTRTEVTATGAQEHTYAQPGEYEVRLSDDISALACSVKVNTSPFRSVYAPMIREVRTTAALLAQLGAFCFGNATNLSAFTCERSALHSLATSAFSTCTSLAGRLDFPCADNIASKVFYESPGITELHFSAANKATIEALPGYDTAFGAENADVFFDP